MRSGRFAFATILLLLSLPFNLQGKVVSDDPLNKFQVTVTCAGPNIDIDVSKPPKYPSEVRKAGIEGTVLLVLTFDHDSRPNNVRVVSGPPLLADAALKAARHWHLKTTQLTGDLEVAVNFRLLGGSPVGQPAPEQAASAPRKPDIGQATETSAADAPVYQVGKDGVTPPRAISSPDPTYTSTAQKAKVQGSVELWLVIDSEGFPRKIEVKKSLRPDLDDQAVLAVQKWRFAPATKDGQPVAVRVRVIVNFRLSKLSKYD
ncbi:MAG: energy transducer TonB [Candidatus Korobacteraceae bacterium]|jgi:protein TonB